VDGHDNEFLITFSCRCDKLFKTLCNVKAFVTDLRESYFYHPCFDVVACHAVLCHVILALILFVIASDSGPVLLIFVIAVSCLSIKLIGFPPFLSLSLLSLLLVYVAGPGFVSSCFVAFVVIVRDL
jgi:hypothetical protein